MKEHSVCIWWWDVTYMCVGWGTDSLGTWAPFLLLSSSFFLKKLGQQKQPRPRTGGLGLSRTLEGTGAAGRTAGHRRPPPRHPGSRLWLRRTCLLPRYGAEVLDDWAGCASRHAEFQLETLWHHPGWGGHWAARARPAGRCEGLWELSLAGIPTSVPTCSRTQVWFPPRARSNPPTLQQIIKTHLYLICLLELIEFLRSANATVCAASRSVAWNS